VPGGSFLSNQRHRHHTRPDGTSNALMRSANSHMDLAVIRARHGDLDEAVHHAVGR
jgi:hypothetical protein